MKREIEDQATRLNFGVGEAKVVGKEVMVHHGGRLFQVPVMIAIKKV